MRAPDKALRAPDTDTRAPTSTKKSKIANILIPIEPHGSGGLLHNKSFNSSLFPNHLTKKDLVTNKKGINVNNDNGKEPNISRDIESTTNTTKVTSLTINRFKITQGNTGNWLNNREIKNN